MPRRALVAALATLVLAGTAWAGDPKAPHQRHTAGDTAAARSIALRIGDLASGWKRDAATNGDQTCSQEPDESRLVQTARLDPSFTWKDGVTNIGSEVDVFRTTSDALLDWRVTTLPLLRDCGLQAARLGLPKGTRVSVVLAETLAGTTLGSRTLRYRIVYGIGRVGTRMYVDVVAFGRGRTTVVFHAITLGAPVPAGAEVQLLKLLSSRLDAAAGAL